MKAASRKAGYTKVSATLEESVLREIRENTDNVSGFLNDAAKRKLYFDRLGRAVEELGRQGVRGDPVFERKLRRALREADVRKAKRTNAAARSRRRTA